jgi:hypothetical protein
MAKTDKNCCLIFNKKILASYTMVSTCLDMHRIFPEGKSYVMREQKSIFEAVHLVSNSTEFRRLKSPMSAPPGNLFANFSFQIHDKSRSRAPMVNHL